MVRKMSAASQIIEQILKYILMFLMALMVLDVSWQVLTRFLLSDPSSFTEELARYLLVWIGLLGASYAYRTHAHLGIDILVQRFQGESKRVITSVSIVISLLFALLVMVKGGSNLVMLTLELDQRSAALNLPMGLVYIVIPLSGFLIAIFALEQLWQLKSGEYERLKSLNS